MIGRAKKLGRDALWDAYHRVRLTIRCRGIERRKPIIVYQMGKVGSSSVVKTVHDALPKTPVFHVHTLSPQNFEHAVRRHRELKSFYLPEHLIASTSLMRHLDRGPFPCNLVTLTREPVSRAISFVFEDLAKQVPQARQYSGGLDVQMIQETLLKLLSEVNGTSDPGIWFKNEIEAVFGIDVFETPHDVHQGYSIYQQGDVRVLVIRMEDIDRSLDRGLRSLLKTETPFCLGRANDSQKKSYSNEIRQVKSRLKVPVDVLKQICATAYFQHFYSDLEEQVIECWGDASTTEDGSYLTEKAK